MYSNLFSEKSVQDLISILPSLPTALWETFYVTVLSTALSLVIGLPLGVLLVTGEKDGVLPLPGWLMHLLNIIINLLRSIPFLILMIMVLPPSARRRRSFRWSRLHSPSLRALSRAVCASLTATSSRPRRAWAHRPSR